MGNRGSTETSTVVTDPDAAPITTKPPTDAANGTDAVSDVPIASINCGSAAEGHTSNDLVTLIGNAYAYSNPRLTEIKHENADFAAYGRSHRWSKSDFGFDIRVPVPGEYDVTLVFCEIYDGAFEAGKRVFSASVEGLKRHDFGDIDVYGAVGANAVLALNVQNVQADDVLRVRLQKGAAENPMISGIVVGPVENATPPKPRPPIPEPDVVLTQAQYDDMIGKLDSYIVEKRENAPSPVLHTPTYMFHNAGDKVRGLIVYFHGFGQYAYDGRIIGRYLYDLGYDIVHTTLAGHFYGGTEWPYTKLAKKYGGDTVAATVLRDQPELALLLQRSERDPSQVPRLIERLVQLNPDFERVMSAQNYMASIDDDEHANFSEYFESTHREYADEGTRYLRMCDAHPGPVHVIGLSVGGAAAIAVAAQNAERVSRCIALTPLLELWEPVPNTRRSQINYIAPLGVLGDFAWDPKRPFPYWCVTANGRFGGSITSSARTRAVFESGQVQLFMVLTEDEDAADIPTSRKFFADVGGHAAGHHFFIYPFSYGVPHPVLDPTAVSRGLSNRYWATMYQQCFAFLTTGHVDTAPMLRRQPTDDLPKPPDAVRGNMKEYARAAQTGAYNRYGV